MTIVLRVSYRNQKFPNEKCVTTTQSKLDCYERLGGSTQMKTAEATRRLKAAKGVFENWQEAEQYP